jgi:hypothetical protein
MLAGKEVDVFDKTIMAQLGYIEKGMESFEHKIDKGLDALDKKIDKLDTRQWQIIILLLSYPLGLIIGKLCHIF